MEIRAQVVSAWESAVDWYQNDGSESFTAHQIATMSIGCAAVAADLALLEPADLDELGMDKIQRARVRQRAPNPGGCWPWLLPPPPVPFFAISSPAQRGGGRGLLITRASGAARGGGDGDAIRGGAGGACGG